MHVRVFYSPYPGIAACFDVIEKGRGIDFYESGRPLKEGIRHDCLLELQWAPLRSFDSEDLLAGSPDRR